MELTTLSALCKHCSAVVGCVYMEYRKRDTLKKKLTFKMLAISGTRKTNVYHLKAIFIISPKHLKVDVWTLRRLLPIKQRIGFFCRCNHVNLMLE